MDRERTRKRDQTRVVENEKEPVLDGGNGGREGRWKEKEGMILARREEREQEREVFDRIVGEEKEKEERGEEAEEEFGERDEDRG